MEPFLKKRFFINHGCWKAVQATACQQGASPSWIQTPGSQLPAAPSLKDRFLCGFRGKKETRPDASAEPRETDQPARAPIWTLGRNNASVCQKMTHSQRGVCVCVCVMFQVEDRRGRARDQL